MFPYEEGEETIQWGLPYFIRLGKAVQSEARSGNGQKTKQNTTREAPLQLSKGRERPNHEGNDQIMICSKDKCPALSTFHMAIYRHAWLTRNIQNKFQLNVNDGLLGLHTR